MLTRFSDFIMGFILACLVITFGRFALAKGIDDDVNAHIKEEFIRMDVAQKRAAMNLPKARLIHTLKTDDWSPGQNEKSLDPQLNHSADLSELEQSQIIERPRAGFKRLADPVDPIEDKIIADQAYTLYREHYRGAVKKELITRAHAAGIEPSNAEADRLTARMIDSAPPPYPSSGTLQN